MHIIRVAVDGGDISPHDTVHSGISRIVRSFTQHIRTDDSIHIDYYFFSHQKVPLPNTPNITYHQLPARGFFSFFLPLSLHRRRTDVFLGFSQAIPRIPSKTKSISFIYDLSFMEFPHLYADASVLIAQAKHAIQNSQCIITCSEYVRAQIMRHFPHVSPQHITAIQPGIDHIETAQTPVSLGFPYFLSVGVIKPIKQIDRMIELFSQWKKQMNLPHQLVFIGPQEPGYIKKIYASPAFQSVKSSLVWKESVTDAELKSYYQQSCAFLLTSIAEGFCFPLHEALHTGTFAIALSIPLFTKYANRYSRLTIVNNTDEFIAALSQHSVRADIRPIPAVYTWDRFTQDIVSKIKIISPHIQ